MLTPTYVNRKYFFYPIGNTPAINLLRNSKPNDQSTTEILTVACGDVRNILFSLWSEAAHNTGSKFNFTVCDFDSAVLARNIFLLSAILKTKEHDLSQLWRVYYHFFITGEDLKSVHEHAQQLHAASETLSAWESSPYGAVLKFTTESTLSEVRRIWASYARSTEPDDDVQIRKSINALQSVHHDRNNGSKAVSSGVRSAGAHGPGSFPSMNAAFQEFWKTGVVAGNDQDMSLLRRERGGRVNPLMSVSSISSSVFAVHYGSDPLLGFHLAEVFDSPRSVSETRASLVRVAKSQFSDWCRRFAQYLATNSVSIMHHCGEAVNFGHALQNSQGSAILSTGTHTYNKPWSASLLTLSPKLVTRFDVIDTSNLIDHVGILNVLPALAPLLADNPGSVLYTESLLEGAESPVKTLQTLLHTNVTTSCLLFGIAPMGHVLGNTTDSIYTEQILKLACGPVDGRQSQFRMRVPWRRALHGDNAASKTNSAIGNAHPYRIRMDARELASLFMKTYLAMFREAEDLSIRMDVMRRKMTRPLAGDLGFYSRLSLVALVAFTRRTIITDWKACMDTLVDMIESDHSLIVSSNSLQELYLHLHTSDLWDVPMLRTNPRSHMSSFGRTRAPGESGILGKQEVPGIVHIALVVPRQNLRIFTDIPAEQVGTPGLHLSVFNERMFDNCFHAIDAFFGRFGEATNANSDPQIEEDPRGWSGSSDLIVTCAVPSWSLMVGRREELQVALVVNTAPSTIQYTMKLGPHMRVFAASLSSANVRVLLQTPKPKNALNSVSSADSKSSRGQGSAATANQSAVNLPTLSLNRDGSVGAITVVSHFSPDSDESKALKNGAQVFTSQMSPCMFAVTVGQQTKNVVFPYPVNGSACKTRIARKSSWIELIAPVSDALQPGGFSLDPFPVADQGDGNLLAWGMGRTNIDQQPVVKSSASSSGWLQPAIGAMLSNSERAMNKSRIDETLKPTMLRFKESIPVLFFAPMGARTQNPGKRIHLIRLSECGDCDTIIIANKVRHDRDAGTIFLDAFLVPVTHPRLKNALFVKALDKCHSKPDESVGIDVSREEMVLWKRFFPAVVERCRTWKHGADCKYKTGAIPLSVNHGEMPICDCGQGKDVQQMPSKFEAFARFATRIAIPLVSAVPFVEPMVSTDLLEEAFAGLRTAGTPQQPTHDANTSSQSTQNSTATGTPAAPGPTQHRSTAAHLNRASGFVVGEVGEDVDACGRCGAVEPGLKACSRCEKVKYCNHACQKAAWKMHKKQCKRE